MNIRRRLSILGDETYHGLLEKYDSIIVKFLKRKDGVDFRKNILPENLGEGYDYDKYVHYVPCRPWQIKSLMKILKITENDSILDIGCGKGKALFDFSKYKFKHVGGVELTEELATIAKENMKILGLPNIEIFCENAINFKDYNKYNHFFFYDPFDSSVFKIVINNILENHKNSLSEITVIYMHLRGHEQVLKEIEGFRLYKSYRNPVRTIIYKYTPPAK